MRCSTPLDISKDYTVGRGGLSLCSKWGLHVPSRQRKSPTERQMGAPKFDSHPSARMSCCRLCQLVVSAAILVCFQSPLSDSFCRSWTNAAVDSSQTRRTLALAKYYCGTSQIGSCSGPSVPNQIPRFSLWYQSSVILTQPHFGGRRPGRSFIGPV